MGKNPKASGVTNAVILQHLQGMRQSLEMRMDKMEGRMGGVENRLGHLEQDVGVMKKDIHSIKDSLQRLYTHRVNMLGRIERLETVVGIA